MIAFIQLKKLETYRILFLSSPLCILLCDNTARNKMLRNLHSNNQKWTQFPTKFSDSDHWWSLVTLVNGLWCLYSLVHAANAVAIWPPTRPKRPNTRHEHCERLILNFKCEPVIVFHHKQGNPLLKNSGNFVIGWFMIDFILSTVHCSKMKKKTHNVSLCGI